MMVGDEWQRFQGPEEVRVIEELLEVGHEITKALRFGWDDHHPEEGLSNRELVVVEMRDLEFQWNELAEKVGLPKISLEKNTVAGEVVSSRDERGVRDAWRRGGRIWGGTKTTPFVPAVGSTAELAEGSALRLSSVWGVIPGGWGHGC